MKFFIQRGKTIKEFSLIYREEEYSFDVEPHEGNGFTSILVNDVQLEIDNEGKIIYVWGLCPLINCEETEEIPKNYETANLIAKLDKPAVPGVSYKLNERERWPIHVNKKRGWICIGNPKILGEQKVEFVPGCVAVLHKQEIVALWLKPKKCL